jgi:hypothetical protein
MQLIIWPSNLGSQPTISPVQSQILSEEKRGTVPPKADSASISLKLYEEGVAGVIAISCPSANEGLLEMIRHNSAAKHTCINQVQTEHDRSFAHCESS